MEQVRKQTEFSRVKYNEAKMGAYFTDLEQCRRISRFIQFPEEDEVCCLEPSIGDGKAVCIITGKDREEKNNLKIYGIELNEETYRQVKENQGINCVKADFLNDMLISQNAFSFVFMNPPYGTSEDGERYELGFLKKMIPYTTRGAVVVVVVPQTVSRKKNFLKEWCNNFDTRFVYRFCGREYEKYKQIVLIGMKKRHPEPDKEEEERLFDILSLNENMPALPEKYAGEKILVPKSSEAGIEQFMPRVFQAEEAMDVVLKSPLQKVLMSALQVPPYLIDNLGRPPIMPSEGHMYLLAVSGAGQGLVGSEEKEDMHLQRGVSKIAKRSEFVRDENGKMIEVEISYPQVSYNIIESSGFIQVLQ